MNVGFVFSVTNTLLLFIVVLPDCTSPWLLAEAPEVALEGEAGVGVTTGATGGTTGAATGVGAWQTEGCPEQVYPVWIWQLRHPEE